MTAEEVVDFIGARLRQRPPAGVSVAYLDGFMRRHRAALVQLFREQLGDRLAGRTLPPSPVVQAVEGELPEHWTTARRTHANIAAMVVAARLEEERRAPTAEERRTLAAYSGWGGLTIEGAAHRFPQDFPVPEPRGLIHEFYTPAAVCAEVARVVEPLLPAGVVNALEPSAGIGRFIRAFEGQPRVRWQAVEYSELSARMLSALRPDLDLFGGSFERWVREKEATWSGRLQLVVSNPPYGARGASISEDPNREYREKLAYHYFLRRALDLLAPDGVGVFLVPAGFLTGKTEALKRLREKVLLRHHLAAAFRLPSMKPDGRGAIFPGAMLVTDLLFFRSRGGTLAEVHTSDQRILGGEYFKLYPAHLLGKEVGIEAGEDDQTVRPRYGYQVVGQFTRLPDVVERPVCVDCAVIRAVPMPKHRPLGRVGVVRGAIDDTEGLSDELAAAVVLGGRVDRYLSALAAEEGNVPQQLWPELHAALMAWVSRHGNPYAVVALQSLAQRGHAGAQRFLSAFTRAGRLIDGLSAPPPAVTVRYLGAPDDVPALAEHLFRPARLLRSVDLYVEHRRLGGTMDEDTLVKAALSGGWFRDGDDWELLVPPDEYLTGSLWPKVDRARKHGADSQVARLMEVIQPAMFDDIEGVSARQGWVPLTLISEWLVEEHKLAARGGVSLHRQDGLVQIVGARYENLDDDDLYPADLINIIGWINHDKTLFKPEKANKSDDIDKVRLEQAAKWDLSFRAWCGASPERRVRVETAYNRRFRGYIAPQYDHLRFPVARWSPTAPSLRSHQIAGANRIVRNRGGAVCFDVGVGKTYTAAAILARARQDGWAKRPVILVPNSIVWKWYEDFARVLPDYRVAVIGSNQKTMQRGVRKGEETSEVDTPQQRGEKWTRFQAGEYDLVLLTYTALGRTRVNEQAVRAYAEKTGAIQREVALRRRNAETRKRQSERDKAILTEGMGAWIAEKMELPEGWEYDPGVAWDDIGVDLLIVDEGHNFKNLYLPEEREGGVPRFMGNPGDGSNRAWQLDFRCEAVRRRTGGSGVVLLTATPAKNSPLELYNLIQFVDPKAWTRVGIMDPEGFIDRYLKIQIQPVVNSSMAIEDRGCVVGFTNLHELRDIIFRYCEFRTAEEVGLKLPEPKVEIVEVDLDPQQEAKYGKIVSEIEAALSSTDREDKKQILGLMARLSLIAVHADLDQRFTWQTAKQHPTPESPKFVALADRVLMNAVCGHIIFVDNVAAHRWVQDVLIRRGISADRIAVLNGETASAAADRQRIAKAFNGDPERGIPPRYDVVIANAIAYEGIDLQTRTCAIHHLDLPWEPATLQQRNGRGVRQGNTLSTIRIYYYFARRSQDGLRFNLIQGKRGWMTQLIKSQDRVTNNPGAQTALGPDEILMLISRNPEQTRARMEEVRARREQEQRARLVDEAGRLLRSANARYRKAERATDPLEAARLRAEGELRLKQLLEVDPEAWPWASQAAAVREREVFVTDDNVPLFEGMRIAVTADGERSLYELGRIRDTHIGIRTARTSRWGSLGSSASDLQGLTPEKINPPWPEDDLDRVVELLHSTAPRHIARVGDWQSVGWDWASESYGERIWALCGDMLKKALSQASFQVTQSYKVPVLTSSGVSVLTGATALAHPDLTVLAPTASGWRLFMEAAPTAGLKWSELNAVASWWWGRGFPRGLVRSAESAADEELAMLASDAA